MTTTAIKRRKGRGRKRSIITTTYHEPKWLKNGRKAVKTVKRQAWNVLGGVGIITVIVLLSLMIMKW